MGRSRRPRSGGQVVRAETRDVVRGAVDTHGLYPFAWKGVNYTLPSASDAAGKVQAGVVIDAVTGPSETMDLRMGLAILQAANVSPEAMKALREMPIAEFSRHLNRWMRRTGMHPGEAVRSST